MSSEPEFGKVVVFGVGLIGGSFALALKAAGQVEEVVGFGRSLSTLTQALDLGIIDRIGIEMLRDPYTLAPNGQVKFLFRRRYGGSVVLTEALYKLEIAAS